MLRVSDMPTPSTEERCATSLRESHEGPVLMAINTERRKQGSEPLSKLTVRPKAAQSSVIVFMRSCSPTSVRA